eukprot:TRINITY_DN15943_c0_g1_i1.p1 TRINITY_DN15943_c0_g1~~TRINITY_DN15943_c0_g1_i1.p1  ORF type:complete len:334 (+),score=83.79 TRINITY_DN15943_c0_g1_i1:87-1004(+)
MSEAKKQVPLSRGVSFTTAGMGGIGAWWLVHPFNTLAVRMSLANTSGSSTGSLVPFAKEIVRKEGVGALYKGIGAGTLRQVFYATSRFGLFEVFRDMITDYRGMKDVDFLTRLVAGSTSGGCAALISCPAEVSLVRMSNDSSLPVSERRNYKNVFDAFRRTAAEEGIGAFWRGSTPFCTRCVIVGCFQVATYDQFKQMFKNNFGLETSSIANVALSANLASLIYSLITMPLETAKNRMAFQKPDASGVLPYRSAIQTMTTVARSEGTLALWNGYLPYYGRCGGHTVGMFILVEQLRSLYRNVYDL